MRYGSTTYYGKGDLFWLYSYETSFGPTRLELKQFSKLRRSLPKITTRVSKLSKP